MRRADLLLRPAVPEDAPAMNRIGINRREDVAPGYPEYNQAWIQQARSEGVDQIRRLIDQPPERYFSQVALSRGALIGYALAKAPPEDAFSWWDGLMIDREYEGRGVARELEAKRRQWAQSIGRPVRALIVEGNDRSLNFFEKQGFTRIDRIEPTDGRPLTFNVVELGHAALMDSP